MNGVLVACRSAWVNTEPIKWCLLIIYEGCLWVSSELGAIHKGVNNFFKILMKQDLKFRDYQWVA